VNTLLQRFNQMRKLMKNAGQMKKMLSRVPRAGAGGM
jgi:signal recognition particle GTPase